jgi:hypothetical protein
MQYSVEEPEVELPVCCGPRKFNYLAIKVVGGDELETAPPRKSDVF